MKHIKLIIIVSILGAFGYTPSVHGLDLGHASEDAGQAGELFDYAASARSMGMGRAHAAVADDASATYWNPAGLTQLERKDMVMLYSDLHQDTAFGVVSYAQPTLDYGTFGITMLNLRSTDFEGRDGNGNVTGSFKQSDLGLLVSHGFNLNQKWALGSTLKGVRQEIQTYSDTGVGLDLGLMGKLHPKIKAGFNIHNLLQPEIKLKDASEKYARDVRLGFSYTPKSNILTALDFTQTESRSLRFNFGGEYIFQELLALRAGINDSELTAGFGFHFGDWDIDYAFAYSDAAADIKDLGGSHRFGFHMNFGGRIEDEKTSVKWIKKAKLALNGLKSKMNESQVQDDAELKTLVSQARQAIRRQGYINPSELHAAQGYVYYFNGDFEQSVQALHEAQILDPVNMELKAHFEKAKSQMSEDQKGQIISLNLKKAKDLFVKGDYKGTVSACDNILSLDPDHVEALTYLEDARARIQEPINRHMKMAQMHFGRENYLEAMKHLLIVKELEPGNAEADSYMTSSIEALKKQASEQALPSTPVRKEVYELGQDSAQSREHYSKGLLFYSQGKLGAAVESWKTAVRLDTNNQLARNAYERALVEMKEAK